MRVIIFIKELIKNFHNYNKDSVYVTVGSQKFTLFRMQLHRIIPDKNEFILIGSCQQLSCSAVEPLYLV